MEQLVFDTKICVPIKWEYSALVHGVCFPVVTETAIVSAKKYMNGLMLVQLPDGEYAAYSERSRIYCSRNIPLERILAREANSTESISTESISTELKIEWYLYGKSLRSPNRQDKIDGAKRWDTFAVKTQKEKLAKKQL